MLRFQHDLERLPVPTLRETCDLYLELARPLLSERELAATERAVAEFVEPGGTGETLQRRLLDAARRRPNWLEPFWDDWYLRDDTPLPVNVSPGFSLEGAGRSQTARAAALLTAAVGFKQLVDAEQLEPDVIDGGPACMAEYVRVCSSTRIPGATRDHLERHPESRHVVVVRGAGLFSLDILDGRGRPYAPGELERALQRIVDAPRSSSTPVGVLTTDDRRTWARVREEEFVDGPEPARELLATLEGALLLLVLDDERPGHPRSDAAARLFLHGDACARWFDKSIQLIVAADGVAGFCMEHSGFDGSTALRFAEFLATGDRDVERASGEPEPRELRFDPGKPLRDAICRSRTRADELTRRTQLSVLDVAGLGKRAIAGHELSPDGFVQMAFQVASSRVTGETHSTYEAVSTKRFLHGRTEAMRCVSRESVAFVSALRRGRVDRDAAARLLRAAVARHTATVARCKAGRGVDRHLLGLRCLVEDGAPPPALFVDPAYERLTRSVLSTSALRSTPGVELSAFGPVVDEGFGLSYTIHENSIGVVVTNFHGLAREFADALADALQEMHELPLDAGG